MIVYAAKTRYHIADPMPDGRYWIPCLSRNVSHRRIRLREAMPAGLKACEKCIKEGDPS